MKHVLSDAKALADDLQQVAAGPCKTADGHGVQLMLNSGPFGELTSQQMSWIDGGAWACIGPSLHFCRDPGSPMKKNNAVSIVTSCWPMRPCLW